MPDADLEKRHVHGRRRAGRRDEEIGALLEDEGAAHVDEGADLEGGGRGDCEQLAGEADRDRLRATGRDGHGDRERVAEGAAAVEVEYVRPVDRRRGRAAGGLVDLDLQGRRGEGEARDADERCAAELRRDRDPSTRVARGGRREDRDSERAGAHLEADPVDAEEEVADGEAEGRERCPGERRAVGRVRVDGLGREREPDLA